MKEPKDRRGVYLEAINSKTKNILVFLLCVLGVFFFMDTDARPDSEILTKVSIFVQMFLFPALSFVIGVKLKDCIKDGQTTRDTFLLLIRLGLYFELALMVLRMATTGKMSFTIFNEQKAPWIFIALGLCLALSYCMGKRLKPQIVAIGAVAATLLAGYLSNMSHVSTLLKAVTYLPFFVAGTNIDIAAMEKRLSTRPVRIASALLMIVIAIAVFVFSNKLQSYVGAFSGCYNFADSPSKLKAAFAMLGAYVIGGVGIVTLFCWMPRKRFKLAEMLYRKKLQILTIMGLCAALVAFLDIKNFMESVGEKGIILYLLGAALVLVISATLPLGGIFRALQSRKFLDNAYELIESTSFKWRMASRGKRRAMFVLWYTAVFAVVALFVFFAFVENNTSFAWEPDGVSAYYSNLYYLNQSGQAIAEGQGANLPAFDFTISLGRDVTQRYISSILNPVQWLAFVWPSDSIEILFNIAIIARFYIAGLFFSIYAFRFSKNPLTILAGSIAYAFCGFAILGGVRHPFFIGMMALFPLLLLGIEQVLHKEKPYLLIVMVFAFAMLSIYFLYISTVMAVIYSFVRFFAVYREKGRRRIAELVKAIGRVVGCYALGALMGAVAWVPSMFVYSASGRIGADAAADNFFAYDLTYYQKVIKFFFAGSNSIGLWLSLGFSVVAAFGIIMLFMRKDKAKQKSLAQLFILGTILICIPLFAYIESGFSNISNRWCFGYALVVAMIIVLQTPGMTKLTDRHFAVFAGCLAAYTIMEFILSANIAALISVVLMYLLLVIVFLLSRREDIRYRKLIVPVVCLFSCISVICNANSVYSARGENYVSQFASNGGVHESFTGNPMKGLSEYLSNNPDMSFFRSTTNDVDLLTDNNGHVFGLNTLSDFNSAEAVYNNYLSENQNAGVYDSTARFGMDNRTMMMELACTKYYVVNEEDRYPIPYGYRLKAAVKEEDNQTAKEKGKYTTKQNKDLIYENEYVLPLGYTYDSYITREEYDKLPPLEKQSALMQAVLLEEPNDFVEKESIQQTAEKNKIRGMQLSNVRWSKGKLKVGAGGGNITLYFDSLPGELYVHIQNMQSTEKKESWSVLASNDGCIASAHFLTEDMTYALDNSGTLINLGYAREHQPYITVSFLDAGTYTLDNIEILTQPMDDYASDAEALREEPLEQIQIGKDVIKGSVNLSKDKILCMAIPYSSINGWTAYVDGKETDIMQANSMYMALEVSKGIHEIKMVYESPGLKICAVASCVGIVLFFVVLAVYELRRKRQKENI